MRRTADALDAGLRELELRSLKRRRRVVSARAAPAAGAAGDAPRALIVEGAPRLDFCSNDYLGLASHPALAAAQREAIDSFGTGAGAAHLITGHSLHHHALEEELAAFTGRERALLFSTGYMANLGVIGALCDRGEAVLQDRLNHASLLDGARHATARLLRYPHADAAAADAMLAANESITLLATDGVFSMDGDVAPLAKLAASCRARDRWLLVDDAHGIGVLGVHGGGSLQEAALDSAAVPLLMGTLGKALGCFGAFVAGDAALIEWLLQRARTYIYTTALPPAVAAAARAALRLCREEHWRREQLHANIARFRDGARQLALPLLPSRTAIQPLLIGDAARALAVSEQLFEAGFWVSAIRPPTVPAGTARLRVTLSAVHRNIDIDRLLEALADAVRA